MRKCAKSKQWIKAISICPMLVKKEALRGDDHIEKEGHVYVLLSQNLITATCFYTNNQQMALELLILPIAGFTVL